MKQPTVLVIEDAPQLSESLMDMLALKGYRGITANTGKGGIELARTEEPDLILLDIRLPDITGYEVYNTITSAPWGNKRRFLVLTASESVEMISKNINLDPNKVLFKPEWSLPDLFARITTELQSVTPS
jgi:response regulator RpfG family c-di-GMP phosphodiesterase